eukprot:scaffold60070_cov35-Attheya_sp.AAC.2
MRYVRLMRTTTSTTTTTDIIMDCTVMVRGKFQSLSIPMVGGCDGGRIWSIILKNHPHLRPISPWDCPCDTTLLYGSKHQERIFYRRFSIDDFLSTDVLPTLFQSTQQIQQESTGVWIQTGFRIGSINYKRPFKWQCKEIG